MTDLDVIKAVCCLAGKGSDVTLEELQLMRGLAEGCGLELPALERLLQKAATDDSFFEEQVAFVRHDIEGAMAALVRIADQAGVLGDGRAVMLMWRVSTKLGMDPTRFEELLAAAGGTTSTEAS